MSESSVGITPGSGGPNVDLEQVDNGNVRQVVCIGDPSSSAKVAPVDATKGVAVDAKSLAPNAAQEAGGHLASIDTTLSTGVVAVAVSGTPSVSVSNTPNVAVNNFPATQPVSAASLPLPANGAKESGGNLDSIKSDLDTIKTNTTPSLGQKTSSQSEPVVVASDQSAIPVSAASLPLPSGAATAANQTNGSQETQVVDGSGHTLGITAAHAAQVDGSAVTQPVSAATLPLPSNAAQETGGNLAAIKADLDAIKASDANIPTFNIPGNRTRIVLSADAIASVTTEAMMTFQSYKAGVVTTGLTSYTVTSGKTFRVTSIKVKIRPSAPSTTVTFANTVLRLREGSLITSPLIDSFPILMQTNVDSNPTTLTIPDGLEFPAGTVLGMSHLASATTILEHFAIVGFEY